MIIIGADYHPAFQQIAFVDTETGELQERRLEHPEEAEKFYRELAAQGNKVRVGMEASGHARWFERLLAELNVKLWIGDAAEIHRKRERKQTPGLWRFNPNKLSPPTRMRDSFARADARNRNVLLIPGGS